jgi:hypothetical protein
VVRHSSSLFPYRACADHLENLNEKFGAWVSGYNDKRQSSKGDIPIKRFAGNTECVSPAPKDLEDHFRKTAKRTVAKDRTVALAGRLYETASLSRKPWIVLDYSINPIASIRTGSEKVSFRHLQHLKISPS